MGPSLEQWAGPMDATAPPWYSSVVAYRKGRTVLIVIVSIFLAAMILGSSSQPKAFVARFHTGSALAMYNSTLGFQKVYAIGFPGRTDKHDALTVASSFTGFDIEWSDGVSFDDIPAKAIPEAFADSLAPESAIGSWRAHLNVLEKVVSQRIETALILEDDADWDINMKSQLEHFARGSSGIQSDNPGTSPSGSPYGDNWDMLWLGHCRAGPNDNPQKVYVMHNDTTVPPVSFRRSRWRQGHVMPEVLSNDTRVVFNATAGMCSIAYAVTFESARKVLASISLGGDGVEFDVTMSAMCNDRHITPFICYAIYPPLFANHRFEGSVFRDSDIQDHDGRWHPEFTYDIVYSAIMNVPRLLTGAKPVPSQWPDDTVPVRGLDEKYVDQVWGEFKEIELRSAEVEIVKGING